MWNMKVDINIVTLKTKNMLLNMSFKIIVLSFIIFEWRGGDLYYHK